MYQELDPKVYRNLQKTAIVLTRVVMGIATAVICGWWWRIGFLMHPLPHLVSMNPLTAICFLASGISLLLLAPQELSRRRLIAGITVAIIPFAISLIRLSDYFTGWDLRVDEIIFHQRIIDDSYGVLSGRMAPNTAINFLLTGIALLSLHSHRYLRQVVVPLMAYAAGIGSLLAILGYIYHVQIFYGHLASFPMAIHTALCFLLMGLALLLSRPDHGGIRQIASTFLGGETGRLLILPTLLVPVILGWLALYGYRTGYFTTELAIGLLVFTLIVTMYLLIWNNTRELNKRDHVQKDISNSLGEANKSLVVINEELDRFAYISSHDLQEPLRKIRIFSSMMATPGADPALLSGKINEAAERMSALITGLLNFSKLQKQTDAFAATDLNTILQQVLIDYELAIREKTAEINISPLPVVNAIPLQMRQLFFNLIGNALKFTESNPVITIQASAADSERISRMPALDSQKKYWILSVKDNGIGFDQEYANKIFVVFQRLSTDRTYTGSGIGLSICKKIAENHSGMIRALSKPGEGATFEIFLPQ